MEAEESGTFFLDLLVKVVEVDGLVRGDVAGQHLLLLLRCCRRRAAQDEDGGGQRRARVVSVSGREILERGRERVFPVWIGFLLMMSSLARAPDQKSVYGE